ncbi:GNAT family N-acetyltransferase [Vulgatibacter incomptus]|uniref:Acetyltransferase, GNAT family n=1 Tax=Vulgatibacter incomptus TaxID=1391653 RepID=A0A0K1PGB6_9BACT|nr:GNAT family N-acetyltransferase [Vulgatibacter incomptus]AKU92560.1 Acetyltransferase, GNAT family [Vulgatibacter incomptus]
MQIRDAAADDYESYCQLLPELQTGDPVPSREAWIDNVMPGAILVESDGRVLGGGWARLVGRWGHVVHVMVAREHQGQGVGRRVMDALAEKVRRAGCTSWYLNVKRDNEVALRLYSSFGFHVHRETTVLRVSWSVMDSLPRDGEGAATGLADPEDDAALEERWSLLPGSVSAARARGELPVRLDGTLEALALFSPSFPGASFFGVERLTLARPMLAALQSHAPGVERISLTVMEPRLANLLREGGAELRFELFQLRGEIPPKSPERPAP